MQTTLLAKRNINVIRRVTINLKQFTNIVTKQQKIRTQINFNNYFKMKVSQAERNIFKFRIIRKAKNYFT